MTKKENILKYPEGQEITLGDGKAYKLAPFNLNTLAAIEDILDCNIINLDKKLEERTASTIRKMLFVLLHDNYPDLKLEDIGELVTPEIMGSTMMLFNKVTEKVEE